MRDRRATGIGFGAGLRNFLPHSSKASIHPTDVDLSLGTPGMGHPRSSGFKQKIYRGSML